VLWSGAEIVPWMGLWRLRLHGQEVIVLAEYRFERMINRLAGDGIPLRLQLWNGRRFDLSPQPTVTISIPRSSALRYFITPDLIEDYIIQ